MNSEIHFAKVYSENAVYNVILRKRNSFGQKSSSISPIQLVVQEYSENLSNEQVELLSKIKNSLSNATNDFEATIIQLNDIEITALSYLTEEEAQPILAGVEIGKASLTYWRENIDEWQQALSEGNNLVKGWFDWSELAGSDVAGAVGGAVGAAIVNVVPGAGQVAYGSAILGTAAGTSAIDGVMQVWNHYL